jgi:adenosylcobinamide-GDP ribazoletransferase
MMERARVSQSEQSTATEPPALGGWRGILRDLAQMVRFYSRLPVPKLPFEQDAHAPPDFSTAPRMLPVAGLIIGLPAACTLLLATSLGLPSFVAAAITIAVAVLSTGAFHEDGLADTFDGLGGGWTPERRLEIMKDSRIGSYGGAALMLSLILRVALLASLLEEASALSVALLYLATASLSRCFGLTPLILLPPARTVGFSSSVGRPSSLALATAIVTVALIGVFLTGFAALHIAGLIFGCGFALTMTLLVTFWAKKAIGGQTGDIAGACQQVAEGAFYVGFLMMIY